MKADKQMIQSRIESVVQRCFNGSTSLNESICNIYHLEDRSYKEIDAYIAHMREDLKELARLKKEYIKAPEYN